MKACLLAIGLSTVVVACGSLAGSGGPPSPTAPAGSVMVTRASSQQTVTAHVGDIQIALGDDINWQLERPDGTVLVLEKFRNYMLVRGTQAIWLAQSAGRSTIKAGGGVNCPSGAACPMLYAIFTATVEVLP